MKRTQILLLCSLWFLMLDEAAAQTYAVGYESKAYQDDGYAAVRQYPLQAYHQAEEPSCLTCNHCQVTPVPIILPNTLILLDAKRDHAGLVEVNWTVLSDEEVLEVNLYSTHDPEEKFSWLSGNHRAFDRYEYIPSTSGPIWYQIEGIHPNGTATWSQVVEVNPLDSGSELLIYPNPGTEGFRLVITGNDSSPRHIRVRDPQGRIMLDKQTIESPTDIVIPPNCSSGIYLVEVIQDGRILRELWLRR